MNGRSKRRAMLASALLGVTVLLGTAGRGAAAPAGNPYNLIDPSTISVLGHEHRDPVILRWNS